MKEVVELNVKSRLFAFNPATRSSCDQNGLELGPIVSDGKTRLDAYRPNYLILQLTTACNLSCDYCYERSEDVPTVDMTLDTACQAIDSFSAELQERFIDIHFFGGEPLLRYDLIKQIILYCESKAIRCRYHISTNGICIDSSMLQYLNSKNFRIIISWDSKYENNHRKYNNGCPSGNHVYNVIHNATSMPGVAQRLWLRLTVTPTMKCITSPIMDVFKLGIKRFELRDVAHPRFQLRDADLSHMEFMYDELADFYLQQLERGSELFLCGKANGFSTIVHDLNRPSARSIGCKCGLTRVTVTPDGYYIPCSRYIGTNRSLGTTLYGLDSVACGTLRATLRYAGCDSCFARSVCGGPCHAIIASFGLMAPPSSPYCSLMRHRVSLAVWIRHVLAESGMIFPGEGYG